MPEGEVAIMYVDVISMVVMVAWLESESMLAVLFDRWGNVWWYDLVHYKLDSS